MKAFDHERLLVKTARLYYEQDMTQGDIASRLRLSRQKVQRLLAEARENGTVRIVIRPVMGVHNDLEKLLEQRYGLREAVVAETTAYDDQVTVARELGTCAAEYLLRTIRSHDTIVLSWGGTIQGMVTALYRYPHRDIEGITVIQGLGAVADPAHDTHSGNLVRATAKLFGGQALLLPAPGIAGTIQARNAFSQDRTVADTLEAGRHADMAIMGIGAPRPDSLLVQEGNIVSWQELDALIRKGAVGDMNLRYFDCNGKAIRSDLDERVIGLTLREIQNIHHVVGVAGGSAKYAAVKGALNGGLVHVLITDHITARRLLDAEHA